MRTLPVRTAVILDEHPLWLEALDRLLQRLEIEVVARATRAVDLQALCEEHRPDLVILDYDAVADDLAALLRYRDDAHAEVRCVVLAARDDHEARERAFAAGTDVICLKRAHADDLAAAIRQAFEQTIHVSTPSTTRLKPGTATTDPPLSDSAGLTKRELEILRLAAEGHSNAQLARTLWVTEQTIKFHLSNTYRKLNVANRTEASRWAQRNGLLATASSADDLDLLDQATPA